MGFIGTTSFGKNKEIWIGLILENGAEGNTNGCVYGKKYFQCRDGKGLFVRPNKIIQEMDSAYSCSTRQKKAKKGNDNNVSLSMSVSSPLHINNARFDILSEDDEDEDEGIVFMDDNNIRMSTSVSAKYPTHSKSLNVDTQLINKRASMTKSKSAQNVNEKYKHKETDTENVYIINQNGKKTKASKRKKKRKQANKASSPRTPMFGRLSHSYSVDTHQIRAKKPTFTVELVDVSPKEEDDDEQTPTPIDAFATLNNYFSLNALYAESDGSNSDSKDMQQYHHHAREESLAQTFDSCEVIPALQSVQQKITPYIGTTEKWKPINHEITPDHGDILQPKLLRPKKQSTLLPKSKSMYNNKISDIGTVRKFKAPKYTKKESAPYKSHETFLDRDKRWYPKSNQLSKTSNTKKQKSYPQHKCKSQSV